MARHKTDPVHIGMGVFENERSLWDQSVPISEHLRMCNEAAVRIAVLAERKRCVETIEEMWNDYIESTRDDEGKPYLRGYRDALEDGCEGLMQLDPQEGADLDSVMAAVADEKRLRAQSAKARVMSTEVDPVYPEPEKPEPDAWEMMQSGEAERAKSTEEESAPTAIEGSEQLDSFVDEIGGEDLSAHDFRDHDHGEFDD